MSLYTRFRTEWSIVRIPGFNFFFVRTPAMTPLTCGSWVWAPLKTLLVTMHLKCSFNMPVSISYSVVVLMLLLCQSGGPWVTISWKSGWFLQIPGFICLIYTDCAQLFLIEPPNDCDLTFFPLQFDRIWPIWYASASITGSCCDRCFHIVG